MAVPKLRLLCSRISCKDLGSNGLKNMHSLEEQFWHLAFTTSTVTPVRIGKTRVATKTSRTTTAWCVAWKWNRMPLAMKCQISNQKRQIFPTTKQSWLLSGKLVASYSLAASLFCTASRTSLDDGCNQLCCTRLA